MDDQLYNHFKIFCAFGAGNSGRESLTDKNLTKMFKDCKIYGKQLTTTDTDIAFNKVKQHGKKDLTYEGFKKLLHEVAPKYAKDHKLSDAQAAYNAMCEAIKTHNPSTAGTTGVSKTGAVGRMTDHIHYTGTHKERFDDSGKGKGMQGRADVEKNDGYVGNYKGSGTYDRTH